MVVVDTCVVIWLAQDLSRLTRVAREAVEAARLNGGVAICAVTLYEIAWLSMHGRIRTAALDAFLADVETRFIVLPITADVAHRAAALPENYPGDPMDRMIAATALHRGVPLITSDKAIRRSKAVEVVW